MTNVKTQEGHCGQEKPFLNQYYQLLNVPLEFPDDMLPVSVSHDIANSAQKIRHVKVRYRTGPLNLNLFTSRD